MRCRPQSWCDVKEAHDEYKKELEGAGFKILFDELEEHDSEVSWALEGGSPPRGMPPGRCRSDHEGDYPEVPPSCPRIERTD